MYYNFHNCKILNASINHIGKSCSHSTSCTNFTSCAKSMADFVFYSSYKKEMTVFKICF